MKEKKEKEKGRKERKEGEEKRKIGKENEGNREKVWKIRKNC
jgi:hypothetical protein